MAGRFIWVEERLGSIPSFRISHYTYWYNIIRIILDWINNGQVSI